MFSKLKRYKLYYSFQPALIVDLKTPITVGISAA